MVSDLARDGDVKSNRQLTRKQRRLVRELEHICGELSLDFYDIERYEPGARTALLELAKDHIIRGEVVRSYTLVDEFLNAGGCNYFFGKKRPFPELWRTKRFRVFNHYALETLTLLEKLSFSGAVRPIPKAIARNVRELNALRNGLAHSFFPENRRTAKPVYKGRSIFTLEGLTRFSEDMQQVSDWFTTKLFL
jgi:hypothetical protein